MTEPGWINLAPGSFPGWWEPLALPAAGPSRSCGACAQMFALWVFAQPRRVLWFTSGVRRGKLFGETPGWATSILLCCPSGLWLMDVRLHGSGGRVCISREVTGWGKMWKCNTAFKRMWTPCFLLSQMRCLKGKHAGDFSFQILTWSSTRNAAKGSDNSTQKASLASMYLGLAFFLFLLEKKQVKYFY